MTVRAATLAAVAGGLLALTGCGNGTVVRADAGGGGSGGNSDGGGGSDAGDRCAGVVCVGQFCNPSTGGCVDCLSNSNCSAALTGGFCNPATSRCVECLQPSDCPYDRPGCSDGTCGGCQASAECLPNQICDEGLCGCLGNAGCGGDAPVCIAQTDAGACGCTSNTDCPADTFCDEISYLYGACVTPCTSGVAACDRTSGAPYCDATSDTFNGLCVQCLIDAECVDAGAGTTCTDDLCAGCTSDTQCVAVDAGTPFCVDECVQCRGPQDCPANQPGCNALTNACGSCWESSDCPSGETCGGGSCS